MGKGYNVAVAIFAIVGIAPWAVFLGGLAKLTDVLTDYDFPTAIKQMTIMLEWYIVAFQLFSLIAIMLIGFGNGIRRSHSFLNMFLAVNTALLILRATVRLGQINHILDGMDPLLVLDVPATFGDPLPFLRALVAGQIACATWNFFLAILISYAGTDVVVRDKHAEGQMQGATMA